MNDGSSERISRHDVAVVVLNYKTPGMVIDCLQSMSDQVIAGRHDVIVVDNASPDDSADQVETAIEAKCWSSWARVVRSPVNGGFAAGNNVGIQASNARIIVLLNSDTVVRDGAIETVVAKFEEHDHVGLVGPRLEWPDGTKQISTFRFRTPLTELIAAGRLGFLGRFFSTHVVAKEIDAASEDLDWVSFACVAIRSEVFERVGLLDETYFMYFEDMDFCRHAKLASFKVAYEPDAAVVHLRGGTSDVKKSTIERRRRPGYYYAARSRYFRAWYGRAGFVLANMFWTLGWLLALIRGKSRAVRSEWRDIWMNPAAGRPAGVPAAPSQADRRTAVAHG